MKKQMMFMIAALVFIGALAVRDLFDTWELVKAAFVAVDAVLIISLIYGMRMTHIAASAVKEVKDHLMSMQPQMIVIREANLMLDDPELLDKLTEALNNSRPKTIEEAQAALLTARAKHEEAKAAYTRIKTYVYQRGA